MNKQQPHLITPPPDAALSGSLTRSILIAPGQAALVAAPDGEVQALTAPGLHQLRSWWQGLLGRQVPPVWLVASGDVTLHPFFPTLLSAEGELAEADMLVRARVADPVRFWRALAAGQADLSQQQLDWLLTDALQHRLRSLVRAYALDSLLHLPEPAEAIRRQFMPSLRDVLAGWGMELGSLTHLSFQPARDAVAIAQEAAAIKNRLDEVRLQARIDELDNEAAWQQFQADFAFRLTPAEEAEIETAADAEAEVDLAERVAQVLDARLGRLEQLVADRLQAQAEGGAGAGGGDGRDGQNGGDAAAAPVPAPRPPVAPVRPATRYDWKSDLVPILRILTTASVFFAALSAYFPGIFPDGPATRLLVAGIGLLLAMLSFSGALAVEQYLARQQAQAEVRTVQARASARRQARFAQEQATRHYLASRLDRVSANSREVMQRVYETDLDLATSLRATCVKAFADLATQMRQADYRRSPKLGADAPTLESMMALMQLNENLLGTANAMVELSKNMYNAAIEHDLDSVRSHMKQLDNGRLDLTNRFSEREQFLLR